MTINVCEYTLLVLNKNRYTNYIAPPSVPSWGLLIWVVAVVAAEVAQKGRPRRRGNCAFLGPRPGPGPISIIH